MASSFRFSRTSSHGFLKFLHGFPDVPYGFFFIVSINILMSLLRIPLWVFLVFLLALSFILFHGFWNDIHEGQRDTRGRGTGGARRRDTHDDMTHDSHTRGTHGGDTQEGYIGDTQEGQTEGTHRKHTQTGRAGVTH